MPGTLRIAVTIIIGALGVGCAANPAVLRDPPRSYAATSSGPWQSLIYAARTDSGVIVLDLGWMGGSLTLREVLVEVGANPSDVAAVFLTHTHRDHITGWRQLRDATFHMSAAEVERFVGREMHAGRVPRLAESIVPSDRPEPGELDVRGFTRDTSFVLGSDTLRAYLLPGHTAGSVAYLFRRVLFVGDALSWTMFSGLRPDKPIHSDDSALNRAGVAALWEKLPEGGVDWVCTAHAKCAEFGEALIEGARR